MQVSNGFGVLCPSSAYDALNIYGVLLRILFCRLLVISL
jgi:hypothetical protein